MDWLEKLNAERRETSGRDEPPGPEFRPPTAWHVLALVAVGAIFLFTMRGLDSRESNFGLAAMVQPIVLGFWVGAGSRGSRPGLLYAAPVGLRSDLH